MAQLVKALMANDSLDEASARMVGIYNVALNDSVKFQLLRFYQGSANGNPVDARDLDANNA